MGSLACYVSVGFCMLVVCIVFVPAPGIPFLSVLDCFRTLSICKVAPCACVAWVAWVAWVACVACVAREVWVSVVGILACGGLMEKSL